jgi:non-ribosomal peptide synthase protein (TIGR01720 family)
MPVPSGVSGELYIGGDGLARGYLHRPDWTAQHFIPDPFNRAPGSRLYRTGDRVRWNRNGDIEFIGRADHQVKVRGFRIELGEIETALAQHASIAECAVVAAEDSPGRTRILAYVVPRDDRRQDSSLVSKLRMHLADMLPEYMAPSTFVIMNSLPLTSSGKVDRLALPKSDGARPNLDVAYAAPRTAIEERLAAIWAEVLGVERVGVDDNFFALGGDSILTIQIVARANSAGLRLSPRQMFQHQTVAELARAAEIAPAIEAEQGFVTGNVPLTPIQHWFFEQELPDPNHFNQSLLLLVRRPLNAERFNEALRRVIQHHDALRLRFVHEVQGWRAFHAAPDEAVPFERIDLAAVPTTDQPNVLRERAGGLQSSLDLAHGPLVRIALFEMGGNEPSRLLIVIHHLLVDGVSWRVLLEDLQMAYGQLERGLAPTLPAKTTSWRAWAEQLAQYASTDVLKAESDYWLSSRQERFARLSVKGTADDNTVASTGTVTVALTDDETRALLVEVPEAYHTQINDALLTALAQCIGEWTGGQRVLIDLEGHGREEIDKPADVSRTVGWFTTVFPVVLQIDKAADPGKSLKSIKEQLRAVPQQGIGYGLLRYLSGDAALMRGLAEMAAPEVSFNYIGQVDQLLAGMAQFGLAREDAGAVRSPRGRRRHVLEINGIVVNGRLQMSWTFSTNLHDRETVERLAALYIDALRQLIRHCQSPIDGGFTPSDFPETGLDQQDLDKFLGKIAKRAP